MPSPTNEILGYKIGDFIYGRSEARIYYSVIYSNFVNSSYLSQFSTIDQFAITEREVTLKELYKERSPSRELQNSFFKSISNNINYKNILDAVVYDYSNNEKVKLEYDWKIVGRKCKAGLIWNKEENTRAHFLLDGIDMNEVVHKHLRNYNGALHRSATGKELRFLYRNKGDQALQKNVQFWNDGKPSAAPWENDRELWSKYVPKSWSESSKTEIAMYEAEAAIHLF